MALRRGQTPPATLSPRLTGKLSATGGFYVDRRGNLNSGACATASQKQCLPLYSGTARTEQWLTFQSRAAWRRAEPGGAADNVRVDRRRRHWFDAPVELPKPAGCCCSDERTVSR